MQLLLEKYINAITLKVNALGLTPGLNIGDSYFDVEKEGSSFQLPCCADRINK